MVQFIVQIARRVHFENPVPYSYKVLSKAKECPEFSSSVETDWLPASCMDFSAATAFTS
jgi:hypothetical protein